MHLLYPIFINILHITSIIHIHNYPDRCLQSVKSNLCHPYVLNQQLCIHATVKCSLKYPCFNFCVHPVVIDHLCIHPCMFNQYVLMCSFSPICLMLNQLCIYYLFNQLLCHHLSELNDLCILCSIDSCVYPTVCVHPAVCSAAACASISSVRSVFICAQATPCSSTCALSSCLPICAQSSSFNHLSSVVMFTHLCSNLYSTSIHAYTSLGLCLSLSPFLPPLVHPHSPLPSSLPLSILTPLSPIPEVSVYLW